MGYAGSNYEPGTITPESGTLAGPGSYVALNSDGEMVLVTSTEGGGTGNSGTRVFSGSVVLVTAGITSSQEILASGNIRTELGDLSGSGLIVSKNVQAQYGTISGSQGIFTKDVQMASDLYVSGSLTVAGAGVGNSDTRVFSGSSVLVTAGITSSAEILASGNIRTELGDLSGSGLVVSKDVQAQYGTISGSKGIFVTGLTSSAEILATGNIRTELGDFSGSGLVVSKDVETQYGTISGSKGIFVTGLTSSAEILATGNIRTNLGTISGTTIVASGHIKTQYASISGSQVIASNGGTAIAAQYGTISGSKGIFVTGLTSSAEILASGNIRTELGDFSGSGLVVSKDVLAQYGTLSGSKLIITDDAQFADDIATSGSVLAELGTISGSQGIFTKDVQLASDLYVSGALQGNQASLLGAGLTTTSALAISADDTLTSGQAISVDLNDAATSAVSPAAFRVDFDKDGVMGAGQVATYQGVHIIMDDAATNHAAAVVFKKGIGIELKNDVAQGSTVNIGVDISGSGGLSNIGIRTCTDDTQTNSVDIMMSSSMNVNDYGMIKVGENGAMTISTVDESHALANIEIEADGDIEMETTAGGKFELQTNTANGAGTGWNTAGMVVSTVANINGEIVTTLLVDIQGTRGHNGTNGNDGRVIGRDGQSNAYLTRVQNGINGYVYKVEISCVEEPAASSGVQKNIVLSADGSAAAQGADGSGYDHLADLNGNWARGTSKSSADGATFGNGLDDDYLYLTNGSTGGDDNDYTAGKFIIKLYGASFAGQG